MENQVMMCLIHTHTVGQAHSASVKPTFDVGPALAQVYPILFHGLWCAPAHELLLANSLRIFVRAGVERGPLQSPFGFASSSENNCNTRRKKGTWHIMEVNRRDEKQEPGRRLRIVQMSGEPAPTKTRERSQALDTRVPGRWLLLARAGWVVLVILTLAIFFAILPVFLAQLQTPCAGSACQYLQLTPGQAETLKGMGLSPGDYAAYALALMLASVVACLGVSTLIVWRRSDDRMAMLVAFLLVTVGPDIATGAVSASPSPWWMPAACLYFLSLALAVLVFLLFPSGQFVPHWMRWTLVFFLAGLVPNAFVQLFIANTLVGPL